MPLYIILVRVPKKQMVTKVLGVWIGEDPSNWDINTKQIMKRTYASMSVLTKLKYAGLSRTKLLHIYALHVRSSMEYCSVVWARLGVTPGTRPL